MYSYIHINNKMHITVEDWLKSLLNWTPALPSVDKSQADDWLSQWWEPKKHALINKEQIQYP